MLFAVVGSVVGEVTSDDRGEKGAAIARLAVADKVRSILRSLMGGGGSTSQERGGEGLLFLKIGIERGEEKLAF